MTLCYLSLGSNLNSPQRLLKQVVAKIKKLPRTQMHRASKIFKTKPWGYLPQPDFFNAVVAINTRLTPKQLLAACQLLEKQFGRVRKKRWGPRTLDIDILFYGQRIIKSPQLTIPHPHILSREFVTMPMASIGVNSQELLNAIYDN